MINDRDMYYGYGGYIPVNNIGQPMQNNYTTSQLTDMNERINRLERQIKRLDQRLIRLETPYTNNMQYNNEPDSNMYMM